LPSRIGVGLHGAPLNSITLGVEALRLMTEVTMPRKRIPKADESQVLLKSRRRCAFCFGLKRDISEKKGQIAHVDRDASNSHLDNLAYLCMEHHDQYDSKTSQSKGLTVQELRAYRDQLYATMAEDTISGIDHATADAVSSGFPRVLVFEDSPMARHDFTKTLAGRAVLMFAVGSRNPEAMLFQADPDLVIVDLNIDGSPETGVRIVRRIKELTTAPIVICSKYVTPDLASRRKWFSHLRVPEGLVARVLPKLPFPTAEQLLEPVLDRGQSGNNHTRTPNTVGRADV
jgi:CheY-like chemotaxis protein